MGIWLQEGQARVSDDRCSSENRNSSAGDSEEAGDAEGSTKGGIQQPQPEPMIADEIEPHQPNFVGESPSQGQSKAALTRQDLEKHFGYGLKEAAVRLGVCNTTLKRACRYNNLLVRNISLLVAYFKSREGRSCLQSSRVAFLMHCVSYWVCRDHSCRFTVEIFPDVW